MAWEFSISDIVVALIAATVGYEGLRVWKYKQQYHEKLETARALWKMMREITVPAYTHPDTIDEDVCRDIAEGFQRHSKAIEKFLSDFSPVIPGSIIQLLSEAQDIAEVNKFEKEIIRGYTCPTLEACKAAAVFREKVQTAWNEMRKDVQP